VLGTYAAGHAAIDASCAVLLWGGVHDHRVSSLTAWSAFVIYNLLAFAVQPLVGLIVDRLDAAKWMAFAGALVTAAALPLGAQPRGFTAAAITAGLGNSLYHIGGGTLSLRFSPGRALPPGVFVAPGAAGVVFGIVAGKAGDAAWPYAMVCVVLALAVAALPAPASRAQRWASRPPAPVPSARALDLVVCLLLLVVGVRSYVGLALAFPWKSHVWLLWTLTAGVVLGKVVGGALADRFGWRLVAAGALLVSAPLLAVGPDLAAAGIVGSFVFNMTMPVTLAALARAIPGHEGFAFGLTCLALFVGSVPALCGWSWASWLPDGVVLVTAAVGAVALWFGLAPFAARRPANSALGPANDAARQGSTW
jgi:FSR family fosmidomycin resistance protein-like MFS transporter